MNNKILLKTVFVATGVAIITAIIALTSKIVIPQAENNVLFAVAEGIILTLCGINAYFMLKNNDCDAREREMAISSLYILLMCFFMWNVLFFVYANFVFAAAISVCLLSMSNISSVLFRQTGIRYCIAMILTELWVIYIMYDSMAKTIV